MGDGWRALRDAHLPLTPWPALRDESAAAIVRITGVSICSLHLDVRAQQHVFLESRARMTLYVVTAPCERWALVEEGPNARR